MDAIIESIEMINRDDYELIPNPNSDKTYYSFPTKKDVDEFRKMGKKFY